MAETGHSKNVENWQKMIAACKGMGADYQPTNANPAPSVDEHAARRG